jgi:hypothetical protein
VPSVTRKQFLREFVSGSKPVIFTELTLDWPARSRWSFDWLKQVHGDVLVRTRSGKETNRANFQLHAPTLREYLDEVLSGQTPHGYLANVDLTRAIPSLAQDFRFPNFEWHNSASRWNFWIGPKGTLSTLHCDHAENLFTQVVGQKRIQLYSPLSPIQAVNQTWYSSHAAHEWLEGQPEELSKRPRPPPDYDFVIEPGEMLYIPFRWWHRITSLSPSISVNLWWGRPGIFLRMAAQVALGRWKLSSASPPTT